MTIQELGVILQNRIHVKILLLNNEFLGMVRQWQQLFFDQRYAETHMKNPDFQMICQGFGIESNRCVERSDLKSALKTMMDHDGAYLLEVLSDRRLNRATHSPEIKTMPKTSRRNETKR